MIKIIVPENNIEERRYIIDIIFNEFLNIKYEFITDMNSKYWEIQLENETKIIFEDHFFNKYLADLEYLKYENIPEKVIFGKNELIKNDIPIIYGTNKIEIGEKQILCGIDVFASSFFMLTRWEEYVNKRRDIHNRFSAYDSLAYKNKFLDRPIVNEYLEIIKNIILKLDNKISFKSYKFKYTITHDIDYIYKWDTLFKFIRHLIGDIIIRKSLKEFFNSLIFYIKIKFKKSKDPYDTFDYLMDMSDKVGLKSHFFFMAKGLTKYDNNYSSSNISDLVEKIKSRGHYIGIHPSYNAYNNNKQFQNEKRELEKNFNQKILFGREHFLRFEIPTTWQIWEDNNMKWDSTLVYAEKEGFRCGVCYEYNVYNIITRKKLKLKEKPLIVMESSFLYQDKINADEIYKKILNLINKVKKYNGEFILLWHNSSFNTKEWIDKKNVYEQLLKMKNEKLF